jgi:hypothetical protein
MATFRGAVANKVPAGEGWDRCHKARMSGQPSIRFVANVVTRSVAADYWQNPFSWRLRLRSAPWRRRDRGRKGAHLDGRGPVARERSCACGYACGRPCRMPKGEPWGKALWFPSLGVSAPRGCWAKPGPGRGDRGDHREHTAARCASEGRGLRRREPLASSRRAWASSHAGKAGGGDPKVPAHGQPPKAAISAAADCRLMPSLVGRGAS